VSAARRRRRAASPRGAPKPASLAPEGPAPTTRGTRTALALLAFLVTLAVFSPALGNGFVSWDDRRAIYENPHLTGLDAETLRWAFTTFHMGPYQPLAWISLAADRELWGLDPLGFHLTAILLHAVNASLLFLVAAQLLALARPGSRPAAISAGAFLAALLWALHPLRVESVAWATERRDVLSALFFLLTARAYLAAAAADRKGTARERRRHLTAAGAWAVLAVLAKPIGPMLAATLVILDVYPLRRLDLAPASWLRDPRSRRALVEKIPFLLLGAVSAVVALRGQESAGTLWQGGLLGPSDRLVLVVRSLAFYPLRTLLPLNLAPVYEVPFGGLPADGAFVLALTLVLGLSALALFGARRVPAFSAAWALFLVHVLPVAGLFQAGPQYAADRYSLLSTLGFFLLAGGVVGPSLVSTDGRAQRFAWRIGATLALTVLVVATVLQIRIWRSSMALWDATVARTSRPSIALSNRAGERLQRGELEPARADLRRALELFPAYADAWSNLALVEARRGDWRASAEAARRCLEIAPDDPVALAELGTAQYRLGANSEARAAFERLVQLAPDDPSARLRLASLEQLEGRADKALEHARVAARLLPGDPLPRLQSAALLESLGRPREALVEAEAALALDPGSDPARALVERLRGTRDRP